MRPTTTLVPVVVALVMLAALTGGCDRRPGALVEAPTRSASPGSIRGLAVISGQTVIWPSGRRQRIPSDSYDPVEGAVETPSGVVYLNATRTGPRLELLRESAVPVVLAQGAALEMVVAADGTRIGVRTAGAAAVRVLALPHGSVVARVDLRSALTAARKSGAGSVRLAGLSSGALFLTTASVAPGPVIRVDLGSHRAVVSRARARNGSRYSSVEVAPDGRHLLATTDGRECLAVLAEDLARVEADRCDMQGASEAEDGNAVGATDIAVREFPSTQPFSAMPLSAVDARTLRVTRRWSVPVEGDVVDAAWDGPDVVAFARKGSIDPAGPSQVSMVRCSLRALACVATAFVPIRDGLARIVPRRGF
jgi:hypothetical protein